MDIPDNLRYSQDHEWIEAVTGEARFGLTAFAAEALGDIVFVQLPEAGSALTAGVACAEVESTKSVSEIYAPVNGLVTAVNEAVVADPSLVNTDPYGTGWLLRIEVRETPTLLGAEEYRRLVRVQNDQCL